MTDLPAGLQPFRDPDQASMRATRRLFEYWRGTLRHGVPLQRKDIDPAEIKDILPFILLGDIETAPFRVRFRLVGTAVVEFSRWDFSGRYLDEMVYGARDSTDWQGCYKYVHDHRVGVVGDNEIRFLDGRVAVYEFAILPLARDDDPAGSFIAAEAYEGFDRTHLPDLTPVTGLT